jgi:hypothetical protein
MNGRPAGTPVAVGVAYGSRARLILLYLRSSSSGPITASLTGDLPRVSRAMWTAPREAERTRRACGRGTQ